MVVHVKAPSRSTPIAGFAKTIWHALADSSDKEFVSHVHEVGLGEESLDWWAGLYGAVYKAQTVIPTAVVAEAEPPVFEDVPELALRSTTDCLLAARRLSGLPVADLAPLIGVKRRQYYNLLDGKDVPPPDRERRIRRVADAIERVFGAAGSAAMTRSALLTHVEGDTINDAMARAEWKRVDELIDQLLARLDDGARLRPVLPRSHRAAPSVEMIAYMRDTRDDVASDKKP